MIGWWMELRRRRRRSGRGRGAIGLAAAVLVALGPAAAVAHGGALELTVSTDPVGAGEPLTVSGEGFGRNATVELSLTGPGGDADLGAAVADDEGAFEQAVTIPGTVVPGTYLVRAVGDEEATAELTVGAMPGMAAAAAEAMPARDRSAAWTAIAILAAVGIGALGLALVRAAGSPADAPAAA